MKQNNKRKRTNNKKYKRLTQRQNTFSPRQELSSNITTGIPDTMKLNFRYTANILVNDAVGGTDKVYVFRGNSLYDPDYTSTGHQPLGFDQWANFYNYYRVLGSRVRVTALNNNTVPSNSNLMLSLLPQISIPTSSVAVEDVPTYPYSSYTLMGPAYSNTPQVIGGEMKTKTMLGLRNIYIDELRAPMSSNPNIEWYWGLHVNILDGASTWSVRCLVEIEYEAELQERVFLQRS